MEKFFTTLNTATLRDTTDYVSCLMDCRNRYSEAGFIAQNEGMASLAKKCFFIADECRELLALV